jgi:hypothetical protein
VLKSVAGAGPRREAPGRGIGPIPPGGQMAFFLLQDHKSRIRKTGVNEFKSKRIISRGEFLSSSVKNLTKESV